ncbi:MAG: SH3 domain-containing protein [Phycisphaerae bacterium]
MKNVRMVLGMTGILISAFFVITAMGETEKKFPFTGQVTGNSVSVRSGPDVNYYPVTRLMRNNTVQVVGEEYGWYKIVPPEGVFSCVSKDFVDKKEGGKGVIKGDRVSIRVWSAESKRSVQLPASNGMEVTIVGEDGNWYKIVPPEGACVWISAKFVKSSSENSSAVAATQPEARNMTSPSKKTSEEVTEVTDKTLETVTTRPTSQPALPGINKVIREHYVIHSTTTQPFDSNGVMGKYSRKLEELDKQYLAAQKKPLAERKYDAIIAGLSPIAQQKDNKAAAMFAKNRLAMIEYQKQAQQGVGQLTELHETYTREITETKIPAMPQFNETNPDTYRYQGCGLLQPSLVFEGPLMPKRFRLFDPEKGRTVAYVELAPNVEINISQYISKNVGVYGTSVFDAKLGFKVIKADAFKILGEASKITNSPSVIQ